MAKLATRILGIDFGLARMGLSISDTTKLIAMPLMTFKCDKKSDQTAKNLMLFLKEEQLKNKYELEEIVIGLPLMMSGKHGFLADEVKHFVVLLSQLTDIPIVTWDERLTTVQAERSLLEGSFSRKKRSQHVDKVAAVIILQNYLDSKRIDFFRNLL